jgi:tryptophan synthase alpha chain
MTFDRLSGLPDKKIVSIFCTAGYPRRDDTRLVLKSLQDAGVAMIELGFPFSDPVADGPTIQASNLRSLSQGMTSQLLFSQLHGMRDEITVPVLLMGYLNPVEQYGAEAFFAEAAECGVDGLILPDMPFDEYLDRYKALYCKYSLRPVFFVTSRTPESRIRAFDKEAPAFLYVLSSDAITGGRANISAEREYFFKKLAEMELESKLIVGFGVQDRASYEAVTKYTAGAIVGSAFVRALEAIPVGTSDGRSDSADVKTVIHTFVSEFL